MQSLIKNHLNSWIRLTFFDTSPAISAVSFQLKKNPQDTIFQFSVLITEPSLYQLVILIARHHLI